MKTYLIFFGKSQDFNFCAFDENGYVDDFNVIIKDFDLLESDVFTIDDVSNGQILAKYNFQVKAKAFSLLKLYSLGQAANGGRIEGSIYGVALLSENDILITKSNVSLLKALKEKFAELSLIGLKFSKSNFKDDVFSIFDAFKKQGYFSVVNLGDLPFVSKTKKARGYLVDDDLLVAPDSLKDEINNTSRLYFSQDLEHLKRAAGKWPDQFSIYHNEDGKYVIYKEKRKADSLITVRNADGENSISPALQNQEYEIEKQKLRDIIKVQSGRLNVLFPVTLLFFLTTAVGGVIYWKSATESKKNIGEFQEPPFPDSSGKVNSALRVASTSSENNKGYLLDILKNKDKFNILLRLCQNVAHVNNQASLTKSDSAMSYHAIKLCLFQLGADSTHIDFVQHKPAKKALAPRESVSRDIVGGSKTGKGDAQINSGSEKARKKTPKGKGGKTDKGAKTTDGEKEGTVKSETKEGAVKKTEKDGTVKKTEKEGAAKKTDAQSDADRGNADGQK